MSAAALMGLCQAVLLITAVVWGLGIQPELPAWLYLFGILMSVTFVALNYMRIALSWEMRAAFCRLSF